IKEFLLFEVRKDEHSPAEQQRAILAVDGRWGQPALEMLVAVGVHAYHDLTEPAGRLVPDAAFLDFPADMEHRRPETETKKKKEAGSPSLASAGLKQAAEISEDHGDREQEQKQVSEIRAKGRAGQESEHKSKRSRNPGQESPRADLFQLE